jgi:hypothetical protein
MLQNGARPKLENAVYTKYTTLAMEELLEDLVEFEIIEEEEETDDESVESNAEEVQINRTMGVEGEGKIESDPLL